MIETTENHDSPSRELITKLMDLAMPPFEQFVAHVANLKNECDKAGELTEENRRLFEEYEQALLSGRGEYENTIAKLVSENFTAEEVAVAKLFFESPFAKVMNKFFAFGAEVSNASTAWTTKVLESCPDTWKMLMENVGKWQRKNTPESWETKIPESPPGSDGWSEVAAAPAPAEELSVGNLAEEEAEIARLRESP